MNVLLHRYLASLHCTLKRVEAVGQLFDVPRDGHCQSMRVYPRNFVFAKAIAIEEVGVV